MKNLNLYTIENIPTDLIETCYIINKEDIPIISSVIITDELWGRLDIIVLRYYSRLDVLPVILDFNGITNVTDINVGDVIDLPNIAMLNENTKFKQKLLEYEVPGFNVHNFDNLTKSQQATNALIYSKAKSSSPTQITAIPKLKVTVNKVKFDIDKGTLTF